MDREMTLSEKGFKEIVSHEAIVPMPYKDSKGIWTLGVGHTKSAGAPNPDVMPKGVAIPLADVMDIFRRDLRKYVAGVNRAVLVAVHQHEFDALVSFHFNTGAISTCSIVKRLNAGDRPGAADAFDMWHKPPEIIGRRDKEKALFAAGSYSFGSGATVYTANSAGKIDWKSGKRVSWDLLGL